MDDFAVNKHFQFGTENPTLMEKPFWKYMICNPKLTAFCARNRAGRRFSFNWPIYCFARFGSTQTYLPDGRLVCIGGEHEDSYDPDFQIYNDVVVINNPKLVEGHSFCLVPVPSNFPQPRVTNSNTLMLGTSNVNDVTIYGYPEDVFAPTDFHTATYVQSAVMREYIYIIGGTGCTTAGNNHVPEAGDTIKHFTKIRVYRLYLPDFSIEQVKMSGNIPWGCTFDHKAELLTVNGRQLIEIHTSPEKTRMCSSTLSSIDNQQFRSGEKHCTDGTGWGDHPRAYRLDIETGVWTISIP